MKPCSLQLGLYTDKRRSIGCTCCHACSHTALRRQALLYTRARLVVVLVSSRKCSMRSGAQFSAKSQDHFFLNPLQCLVSAFLGLACQKHLRRNTKLSCFRDSSGYDDVSDSPAVQSCIDRLILIVTLNPTVIFYFTNFNAQKITLCQCWLKR